MRLVTSLPPTMSRKGSGEIEIGAEYASTCIASWRCLGLKPISVNSARESQADFIDRAEVEFKTVERDASDTVGKPMVFLNDMIRIASNASDGPVVITNADIIVDASQQVVDRLKLLQPGAAIISKRVDIDLPANRVGSEYPHGYDFFVLHPQDIKNYADDGFVFGVPWWDHYFPLWLVMNRIKITTPERNFVFHLKHEERWDPKLWADFGMKFVHSVTSAINTMESAGETHMRVYASNLRGIGANNATDFLHRVSNLNLSFLDHVCSRQFVW